MARKFLVRIGIVGAWVLVLGPSVGSANQFNIPTITPVRPQIHLGPSLRMDTRARNLDNIDLSEACRPDERLRKTKRERRCRRDR